MTQIFEKRGALRPFSHTHLYLHTSWAICCTKSTFAYCSASVSLLPISQEAKPHCGLR